VILGSFIVEIMVFMSFQIIKKSRLRLVGITVAVCITSILALGFMQSYQKSKQRRVKKIDLVAVDIVASKPALLPILYELVPEESCIKQLTFNVPEAASSSAAWSRAFSSGSNKSNSSVLVKPEPVLVPASSPSCIAQAMMPIGVEKLGDKGFVTLELNLAKTGRVERGEVYTSSGFSELDEAALVQVKETWKFQPCTKASEPVACKHFVRVRWFLESPRE
jgi:TonB family protein